MEITSFWNLKFPMEFFLQVTGSEEVTGCQVRGIRRPGLSGESQLFSFLK
jgi:hypothetical protein